MSEGERLRVATRGSRLALTQTGQVVEKLKLWHPGLEVETVVIKTTGDKMQTGPVKPEASTKSIFTKEIEEALLRGDADFAVHSAKDLAVAMPSGLVIAAVPERQSVRDVLICRPGAEWPRQDPSTILTGSIRRRLQWLEGRPDDRVEPIRGNIDTRIAKLIENPSAQGLILAEAGLKRLEPVLSGCRVHPLELDQMIPAPGQGALALQCREDDKATRAKLSVLEVAVSRVCLDAERAFLEAMEAGCQEPLGALAEAGEKGMLSFSLVYYPDHDPSAPVRRHLSGQQVDPVALGRLAAEGLKGTGK